MESAEIFEEMRSTPAHLIVAPRNIPYESRRYAESWGMRGRGVEIVDGDTSHLPVGRDVCPDLPGWEVIGYRVIGKYAYSILKRIEYDWAELEKYCVICLFYKPDGMIRADTFQDAGDAVDIQMHYADGVYHLCVRSSGPFDKEGGRDYTAALMYVEDDLGKIGPTRELLRKMMDPLRVCYAEAMELAMQGNLTTAIFQEMFTNALGSFPEIYSYEGDEWFIEFVVGVAIRTIREEIMQANLDLGDSQEYLNRERALVGIFECEANTCREIALGQHNLERAWEWSWLLYDGLGRMHFMADAQFFHSVGFWWHHDFHIPRERIIVIDGSGPGVGKSTLGLALVRALGIGISDVTGVRTTGGRGLKDDLRRIRALTDNTRIVLTANNLYVQTSVVETGSARLTIRLAEERSLGLPETGYGVRYCLHTWIGTNIRMVAMGDSSIVSNFKQGDRTRAGTVTPEMWEEVTRSLREDPEVHIPAPVRSRIEDHLRIVMEDFNALGAGGIGYAFLLDKPVSIILQNLARDTTDKPANPNHMRRQAYLSEESLILMRLVALVYAEAFGIPVIQGAVRRGEAIVELQPSVLAWMTARRLFVARLIDRLKRKKTSWPEPLKHGERADAGIWGELNQTNIGIVRNLNQYSISSLWKNPTHTEFIDFKERVLGAE